MSPAERTLDHMLTGIMLFVPPPAATTIAATLAAAVGAPTPTWRDARAGNVTRFATVTCPDGGSVRVAETAAGGGDTLLPASVEITVPDLDAALARIDAAVPDARIGAAGTVAYVEVVPGFKVRLVSETRVTVPRLRDDPADAATTFVAPRMWPDPFASARSHTRSRP